MQLSGKTIAITGAGSFIGRRMVERARQRGMRVRGLEKSPAAAEHASMAGAETIVGDVCSPADVQRLCVNADIVFHTAAVVKEGGDPALFEQVNVGGTRNVASQAAQAGVARFVQLSSVMVYGFHYPEQVREDGPLVGAGNPYCQTKIDSERVAMDHHGTADMDVTVIRAGDVYGPGSVPWTIRPLELIRRRLLVLPNGGRGMMNHVYVDNLLDGVLLALERDVSGEAINITDGQRTTFRQFFEHYARMVGGRRLLSLPVGLLRPLVTVQHRLARLLGRQPLAAPEFIPFCSRRNCYSIEKARRVLGFHPKIGLDEGMALIEQWLARRALGLEEQPAAKRAA